MKLGEGSAVVVGVFDDVEARDEVERPVAATAGRSIGATMDVYVAACASQLQPLWR